jgi:hypothetical protein
MNEESNILLLAHLHWQAELALRTALPALLSPEYASMQHAMPDFHSHAACHILAYCCLADISLTRLAHLLRRQV